MDELMRPLIEERLRAAAMRDFAEADQFWAIAERHRADIAHIIRESDARANLIEMEYTRRLRQENLEKAYDQHHRVYRFSQPIVGATSDVCQNMLSAWYRQDPKSPITLEINSPGGDMISGFALYDFIQHLVSQGADITTYAIGVAASMAAVVLQAGKTRVMGRQSWLLLHESSFEGEIKTSLGEMEDTMGWVKDMEKRIQQIFKRHSPLDEKEIAKRMARKQWWVPSDEALKLGFVDEVR